MTEYVCGFLFFGSRRDEVAMILKNQAGRYNGIGGRIEAGETPREAMVREFREEAGLEVQDWQLRVQVVGSDWCVYYFSAVRDSWEGLVSCTDELVGVYPVDEMPQEIFPNLRWLVPLCRDTDIKGPVTLYDLSKAA